MCLLTTPVVVPWCSCYHTSASNTKGPRFEPHRNHILNSATCGVGCKDAHCEAIVFQLYIVNRQIWICTQYSYSSRVCTAPYYFVVRYKDIKEKFKYTASHHLTVKSRIEVRLTVEIMKCNESRIQEPNDWHIHSYIHPSTNPCVCPSIMYHIILGWVGGGGGGAGANPRWHRAKADSPWRWCHSIPVTQM